MSSLRPKGLTFCHKRAIIKLAFTKRLGYRRPNSKLALISHRLALLLLHKAIRSCAKDQVSLNEHVPACSVSALRAPCQALIDKLQLNTMSMET